MKKFLIIGNQNAINYKEIFPLIKNKNIWLGINNGSKTYRIPDSYSHIKNTIEIDGNRYTTLGNTCWYTNLEHKKRHQKTILFRTYEGNESEYPKYDNYDAINVDKATDIPYDYYGEIGIPITFLPNICPEQFEIIDALNNPFINKKEIYKRLIVKRIDLDDKEFYGLFNKCIKNQNILYKL